MTLFEKAARVFPGRTDSATGCRVLRLATRSQPPTGFEKVDVWRTFYHQHNPFLDGGRRVVVRSGAQEARRWRDVAFDLETGACAELACGSPVATIVEVSPGGLAARIERTPGSTPGSNVILADVDTGKTLNRLDTPDWLVPQIKFLDDRTLCVGVRQGKPYDEPCRSRFYVLDASGAPPRLVLEEEGFFCNHMMPRPGHPDQYSYDRWPTPKKQISVITRLRTRDGSRDWVVPLAADAVPCGPIWGGQRDHYLWSADGRHIVSYFSTGPEGLPDHYDFVWWLNRWDVETGRDTAVLYPPERWGCNFAITPDGRYVVSAGGRGHQFLYRVDLTRLEAGWNEQTLCAYPYSEESGLNHGSPHMPHVLPDGSGVVFCAGWPGPDDGAYLVEMPAE